MFELSSKNTYMQDGTELHIHHKYEQIICIRYRSSFRSDFRDFRYNMRSLNERNLKKILSFLIKTEIIHLSKPTPLSLYKTVGNPRLKQNINLRNRNWAIERIRRCQNG